MGSSTAGATIAAIASPPGPAARGILRLSGDLCAEILGRALLDCAWQPNSPRGVYRGRFDDGTGSQPLLLLWMPGPYSYTREDVAELHLPGSPPLLQLALEHLLELGAKAAGPGEFTRRAFQNGRIDLTRAEGVLELVRASNEAERRSALELLGGGLGQRLAGIRAGLDAVRALCEASLDFDESDTGHVPEAELRERMQAIALELQQALSWESARQPPTALPRVLLFGAPNAGKSSLYNSIAADDSPAALVSALAGTTRDYLSRVWRLGSEGSQAVLLIDTPGLDSEAKGVDASAQRLAAAELEKADLVLWVVHAIEASPEALERQARALPAGVPVLGLRTQMDREAAALDPEPELASILAAHCQCVIRISALREGGLGRAAQLVGHLLGTPAFSNRAPLGLAHKAEGSPRELFSRHRRALESAATFLGYAEEQLKEGYELDWVAETLRVSSAALDEISGSTTPEDLLDRIFSSFCIGK